MYSSLTRRNEKLVAFGTNQKEALIHVKHVLNTELLFKKTIFRAFTHFRTLAQNKLLLRDNKNLEQYITEKVKNHVKLGP